MDCGSATRATSRRISAVIECSAKTCGAGLKSVAKNCRVSDHDAYDVGLSFAVFILTTACFRNSMVSIFMAYNIAKASIGASTTEQIEINVAVVIGVACSGKVGSDNETCLCCNGWIAWRGG